LNQRSRDTERLRRRARGAAVRRHWAEASRWKADQPVRRNARGGDVVSFNL